MINLVYKNIKNSFLAYRNIYSLLFVSQFVGIIILLLVYGIITNYNIKIEEKQIEYKYIDVHFDEPVSATAIKDIIPKMISQMEERLEFCYIEFKVAETDLEVTSIMAYNDGEYCMPEDVFPNDRLADGRYPTNMELMNGDGIAFAYGNPFHNDPPTYIVGDKYIFRGKTYEIVGVVDRLSRITRITIPINSCTSDMKVKYLSFDFTKFPTQKDYEMVEETMTSCFGSNAIMSEFKLVELDDIVRYNSIILLAFIIGGIATFDTIMLYSYLLEKRKRQMAIFSVEGATRWQRVMICAIEVLSVTLITTIFSSLFFELVVKDLLLKAYKPSMEMYTIKVYLYLALTYIGTIVIGTSTMINIATRRKVWK